MRGRDERGVGLFSYVDLEARVPADHPLRAIRVLVDEALAALSGDFARLYSHKGRPLIAPETVTLGRGSRREWRGRDLRRSRWQRRGPATDGEDAEVRALDCEEQGDQATGRIHEVGGDSPGVPR